jgi:hypothetical protein
VSAATTGAAIRRLRAFLGHQEPELVRRSFAASTNPRLGESQAPRRRRDRTDNVIRFPTRDGG